MTAHVLQYIFISLIASLVYHALRVEDVRAAAIAGFKRFVSCLVLAIGFGIVLELATLWI